MQIEKKWVKTGTSTFSLWYNNEPVGTMDMAVSNFESTATATFGNETFTIKRTGFWKSDLVITGENGQVIATVFTKKWYASSLIVEYDNRNYQLFIRNNPLAEWVLQEGDKEIIAYGLGIQDGKPCVRITTASVQQNFLFDFLLWYLFVPIATEQSADDFVFQTLLAAQ